MQRRRLAAAAMLWFALTSTAAAQGEPEQRVPTRAVRTVAADYSYAWFRGDIDPWHLGSVSVGSRTSRGSIIGRVNVARRFETNGAQAELDAYPGLGDGSYAYLNAGYSRSTIFPEWRFGGELFRSLPRAYEASLGFRQLRFGGPPVTLFTGSVGRYTGNYWLSLRPYVRDRDNGLSASASLTARRYTTDADNYVGARIGYGTSPSDDVVLSQLTRLNSTSAALNASRSASARVITTWSLSFEREELAASRYRNRWEFGGGVKLRY